MDYSNLLHSSKNIKLVKSQAAFALVLITAVVSKLRHWAPEKAVERSRRTLSRTEMASGNQRLSLAIDL